MTEKELTVGELKEMLNKFPEDKPVKIMGYYSIMETDDPELIHDVCYLKEVDWDTFEIIDEITDYVAIVTDQYLIIWLLSQINITKLLVNFLDKKNG